MKRIFDWITDFSNALRKEQMRRRESQLRNSKDGIGDDEVDPDSLGRIWFDFLEAFREERFNRARSLQWFEKDSDADGSLSDDRFEEDYFGNRGLLHRLGAPLRNRRLWREQAKQIEGSDDVATQSVRVRELRDLFKGGAAIGCGAIIAVTSAWGYLKQRESGVAYWRRGERAIAAGDFRAAEVYLQKSLNSRNTDKARISLTMAQAYEQQGDLARAAVIMESLAPIDEVGLPEAHLFVAMRMAEQLTRGESPNLSAWKWHIDHASASNGAVLDKLRADYYLALGDPDSSFAAAEKAAEKEPALWLNIAIGRQQQGKVKEAKQALLRARNAFETDYRREPDKFEHVQRYVTALMLNNELATAREVILEAQKSMPRESLNPMLAQLYLLYADQSMTQASVDKDPSRVGFAVRALLESLRLTPNNPQTLARITAICQGREEERDLFRKELLKVITDGTANEEAFFAMGVMDWTLGDIQGAIKNTRQALKLAPQMTAAANNLAMFLTEQETPDLDTALQVIDEAIEQGPILADFIDTRAQILTKRGEYADAITEYLKLLKMVDNKSYVRERLADLYALTGEDELAREMREALE